MALPMQQTPSYTAVVPSTGDKIQFRPFLVKEQKSLLLAQQSEDQKVMIDTLKGVISACTSGKVNPDELALFDLEYLFTQIRAKSVGETVELIFSCDDCDDEKAKIKIPIDLTKIEVTKDESHNKKIPLFDDVGVVMKYPSIDMLEIIGKINENSLETVFNVIGKCIDYIYNSDEVFYSKETSDEEMSEFLNNLTQDQFAKIQKFFETTPKISSSVQYKCPVCSKQHNRIIEGMNNFF